MFELFIFALYAIFISKKAINIFEEVWAEKNLRSWTCEKFDWNEATISRWSTTDLQPNLNTLVKISELLEINISELINDN